MSSRTDGMREGERNLLLDDPLLEGVPVIEGYKVLDRCVLFSKLGQGGMGAVYRGRHLKLDLDVAVKCLKPVLAAQSEEYVVRFEREARTAARLGSDNLVRVIDVDSKFGLHYLVMEYVAGESLAARLRRKGALSPIEAATIIWGAAKGLSVAHEQNPPIVHRDIKPDNIMISAKGAVKVADLGLARVANGDRSMTMSGMFMGTPYYAPPEQFRSAASVTPASDVWSLGATLYEILTLRHAYSGDSLEAVMYSVAFEQHAVLSSIAPDVPEDLAAIVERCLDKNPANRFRDAVALADALDEFLGARGKRPSLADRGADGSSVEAGLVSPPPGETLVRIKLAVSDGGETRATVANPSPFSNNDRPTMVMEPAASKPPTGAVKAGRTRSKTILAFAIVVATAAIVLLVFKNPGGSGNAKAVRDGGSGSSRDSRPNDRDVAAAAESRGGEAASLPSGAIGRDLARPGGPESMVARRYREALDRKAAGKFAEAVELLKIMYQRNPRFENVVGEYASTLLLLSDDQKKRGESSAAVLTARTAVKVEDSERSKKAVAVAEESLRNELKSSVAIEASTDASALGVNGVVLKGTSTYRPSTKVESGGRSVAVVDGRFTIDVEVPRELGRSVELRVVDVATGVDSNVVFRVPIRRNRK